MSIKLEVLHRRRDLGRLVRKLRLRGLTYKEIEVVLKLRPANGNTAQRLEREAYGTVPKFLEQKYA